MATAKRAPCVNMRTDVHKDERFAALADIAGMQGGRYEAIGRMHGLYSWCVDRKLRDAPDDSDGYVVSAAVICRFLGSSGVIALLAEGCDELALGKEIGTGRYYLRGTSEYVSTMRGLNRSAVAGGKSQSGNAPRVDGKFVAKHTITPAVTHLLTSGPVPADQPEATCQPAVTSALPFTLYRKEEEAAASPPAQPALDLEPKPPKQLPAHAPAVDAFDRYFRSTHDGACPTWDAKHVGMVKTLVAKTSCSEVVRRIENLSNGPPKFPPQPWDLKTFVGNFDNCAALTRPDAQDQRGGIRTNIRPM